MSARSTSARFLAWNSCHGGRRVGRGRCWKSHGVRFAEDTILSYLIIVVPSVQCCESVISPGLRSAVRRPLISSSFKSKRVVQWTSSMQQFYDQYRSLLLRVQLISCLIVELQLRSRQNSESNQFPAVSVTGDRINGQ